MAQHLLSSTFIVSQIDGNNVDAIQFLTQGNRRFKKTFNIVTKRNTMMAVQVQLY